MQQKSAYEINKTHEKSAKTPIIDMVHDVLYHEKNPKKALQKFSRKTILKTDLKRAFKLI